MQQTPERIILMADDDSDDRYVAERALRGTELEGALRFVEDGIELMDYLHGRNDFTDAVTPALILLDLNMPRMSGMEVLAHVKQDPNLRRIPVVVLTTSSAEEDVIRSYDLGVNAYVTKPVTFSALKEVLVKVGQFWLEVARPPLASAPRP